MISATAVARMPGLRLTAFDFPFEGKPLNSLWPDSETTKDRRIAVESKVAQTWLQAVAATANAKDYEAHMDLISRNVKVFGIPDFDVITYEAWAAQCRHEFGQNILKQVSYDGIKVLVNMPGRVMFKTMETIEATDGTVNTMAVEIVIEKETDGKWRVTQERILSPEETALDQDQGGY